MQENHTTTILAQYATFRDVTKMFSLKGKASSSVKKNYGTKTSSCTDGNPSTECTLFSNKIFKINTLFVGLVV